MKKNTIESFKLPKGMSLNKDTLKMDFDKTEGSMIHTWLGQKIIELSLQRLLVNKKSTIPEQVITSQLNQAQNQLKVIETQLEVLREWKESL